jgi:formylmethanofuran dehydrogenase subunit E
MKPPSVHETPEAAIARLEAYIPSPRLRDYVKRCVAFHGHPAPGLIIGVFMVDLALELLGATPEDRIYAVCETRKCAPDPLQVIAGCTVGNLRLRVLPIGRFAITMNVFSKGPLVEGVRVFVDSSKLEGYPAIHSWYMHSPKFEKSQEASLVEDILTVGRGILSHERVRLKIIPKADWHPETCPSCGELIPDNMLVDGACVGCGSLAYYEKGEA